MEFISNHMDSLLWAALFSILLFLLSTVIIGYLAKKSSLLKPIGTGLKLIVLFILIQIFLPIAVTEYHPRVSRQLSFVSWLIFTFAAIRIALYLYGDLFIVRRKQGSFPAAFKNIITASVIVIVTLLLLKEILDVNVTSLIATTTVLTATLGLALQGTLANMLAGLTIHLEKPLKQGDWISAGGHEGRVMDITLRSTRIVTIENNEVCIPNSKVLSEAVVNYSLPNTSQIRKLVVGVSYAIPPNKVIRVLSEVLSALPRVSQVPAPFVRVISYGEFAVQYELRYTITDFSAHVDIEAEILNLIWYQFKRNTIDIPYPVRTVHVSHVTEESHRLEKDRQHEEILGLLENVDILAPLSKSELKKLVPQLRVKTYAANELPVKQGDAGDSFYIIKSGRVEVVMEQANGHTSVVATLATGDFFGEMSLLTGEKRTASILVKEDAEFIVIDKESFSATLANNPSIAESLSQILSARQAGLDAERGRLDVAGLARRKKDASGKMLSMIKEFFGL